MSTFLVISLLIVHFTLITDNYLYYTSMVVFACRQYGCYRRQRITDGTDSYSGHQDSGKYTVQLHVLNMHMSLVMVTVILLQKCIVLSFNDTVWAAKQLILDKIFHVRLHCSSVGISLSLSSPSSLGHLPS